MITIQELYAASTQALLQTDQRGDGHYFFGRTELGLYRLDTHCNYAHREEVSASEHYALLQQGASLIAIQMIDWMPVGEYALLLAHPRNLAENSFFMEDLINILQEMPNPNILVAFSTTRLVDPNEPWLAAIFASLQNAN